MLEMYFVTAASVEGCLKFMFRCFGVGWKQNHKTKLKENHLCIGIGIGIEMEKQSNTML